ncbi:MAG: helix-turn-helix transcriptional regulator, partial [Chloroflexota bacterium]|nr:helix-turn-helix transcriptional regulator [Chloroflexota bacterium]
MTTTLLQTKLYIPQIRPDLVSRSLLVERLNVGLGGNLTLVSAPAGFGKTTLLSQWAEKQDRSVAWVSLDRGDNDPIRFWTYVIAAMQRVRPNLGETVLSALSASQRQAPLTEAMLTGLINEIAEVDAQPFVLVLDDYHLIDNRQVNDDVAFLVEFSPSGMHVILSGRADPPWPLARMRARRQMNELRSKDMRFTQEEATAFLNDVMGLDLSVEDIAILDSQTEGWIAGLQMAALSMQGREDVSGFINAFSGSHRFILDYLVEEVLERCPAGTRDFLIKTSVLERMTAPLCDAITGRNDSAHVLAELEQANLFLVPLDDERRWYRYHHLFGDLLYSRLEQHQPDQIEALHRRASEWNEKNGLLAEAMSHASAAEDTERQVRLIADNVLTMAYLGELTILVQWLDALPVDAGQDQPWFHVSRAWVLVFAGHLDEVEQHLCDAEEVLGAAPGGNNAELASEYDHVTGHIAAIRGYVAGLRGEFPQPIEYAREALARLPESDAIARGWTTLLLAVMWRAQGDLILAEQAFLDAATINRNSGNILLAVDVLWEHSVQQQIQGQLHKAFDTCQQVLQLASEHVERGGRRLPPTGYTHIGISNVLYEWNDLESALTHAEEAVRLCKRWGMADAIVRSQLQLAMTLQANGDEDGALSIMQEARQVAETTLSPMYRNAVAMATAQLHLIRGNVPAASRWADEQGLSADDEFGFQQAVAYLVFARLLIAQGGASLHGALGVLERLQELSAAAGAVGNLIGVLALKALALQAQGDEATALESLNQALSLGEQEGYMRTFIDEGAPMGVLLRKASTSGMAPEYARRLLEAMEGETVMVPHEENVAQLSLAERQPLVESLTERELDVLRLLKTSLSATEIAG